jgi:hypothetical protein
MMKKLMMLVGVLALLTAPVLAAEQLVGYWNFNSNDLPGGGFGYLADPDAFPLAADAGIGNAALSIGGGIVLDTIVNGNGDTVYQWVQSFGGSTLNALFDDVAGGNFSLQGGTDVANNGAYLQLAFDMTELSDLQISYATRGTSSGFTTQTWSWSTDGVTFTDFATIEGTNVTSFFLVESPVVNELDFASTAYLRLTFDGATGSTGNNRVDNLVLMAQEAVATEQHSLSQIKSLFQ